MKDYKNVILAALEQKAVVDDINLVVPQKELYDFLYDTGYKEFFEGTILLIWRYVDADGSNYELELKVPFKIDTELKYSFSTEYLYFVLTNGDRQGILVTGYKKDLEKITSIPDLNQVINRLDHYDQSQKITRFETFIKGAFNVAFNLTDLEFLSIC